MKTQFESRLKEGINKGWTLAKLKYYLNIRNGKEIVNLVEDERGDAIDVYGSGGVFKKTDTQLYSGQSVLFGRKGTIGKPIYVNGKFWTVDTMYYTTFFNNLVPKWAYYMFTVFPWEVYTTKTALPSIVGTEIENAGWVIPPKKQQELLVNIIDQKTSEIDALIADKEKLITLLEEKRQATITEAVTKGLNPNVKMKGSGVEWIGEIPDHWEVKKIKHLLKRKKNSIKTGPFGSHLSNKDMESSYKKVFNQKNVLKENFDIGDYYVSRDKYEELKGFEANKGDLLVTTRGTIGRAALVPEDTETGILHPCLIRMDVNSFNYSSKLLKSIFNETNIIREQVTILSNSTTIEVIYSDTLKNIFIPMSPNLNEQKKIVGKIESYKNNYKLVINDIMNQISKLKEYRQSLIYEAVTGKIDIQEMEREITQEEVSSS